jgi:hypothetical protein
MKKEGQFRLPTSRPQSAVAFMTTGSTSLQGEWNLPAGESLYRALYLKGSPLAVWCSRMRVAFVVTSRRFGASYPCPVPACTVYWVQCSAAVECDFFSDCKCSRLFGWRADLPNQKFAESLTNKMIVTGLETFGMKHELRVYYAIVVYTVNLAISFRKINLATKA